MVLCQLKGGYLGLCTPRLPAGWVGKATRYWGYVGGMETNMETTIVGYIVFRGLGFRG